MKISRRLFLTLNLALGLVSALSAADSSFKYLGANAPDPIALLAPPPIAGSAEERADADSAFRVAGARTSAERAHGVDEINLTVFHFSSVVGPGFVPGKFPRTEALFQEMETEMKSVTAVAKKHWQRIRPYHAEPARFPDAIEQEPRTDYSYPSGHSTRGTAYALILAELFPDRRDALLAKGCETGWLRVLGGVHYPTDVYAGRVLGKALAQSFLRSDSFRRDLEAAQSELKAAHLEAP